MGVFLFVFSLLLLFDFLVWFFFYCFCSVAVVNFFFLTHPCKAFPANEIVFLRLDLDILFLPALTVALISPVYFKYEQI